MMTAPQIMPENRALPPCENVVRETISACNVCYRTVPALVYEREGALYLRKTCADHGESEALYFDDAALYKTLQRTHSSPIKSRDLVTTYHPDHGKYARVVLVDLLRKCQLTCPTCLTSSSPTADDSDAPSADELVEGLLSLEHRPVAFLLGGEPTLRDDLLDIIHRLSEGGMPTKIATNGFKLADRGYVRALREAGLGWVYLQFDGFEPNSSIALRNVDIVDVKRKALANLEAEEVRVGLACCIDPAANGHEMGRILRYGLDAPTVHHVQFLPAQRVGRHTQKPAGGMGWTLRQVIEQSEGRMDMEDFMFFRRLGYRLYNATKNPSFQQRSCYMFAPMMRQPDGTHHGMAKLANPGFVLRHPVHAARTAWHFLNTLPNFDMIEIGSPVTLVAIETFHAHEAADLYETSDCCRTYWSRDGFLPVCTHDIYKNGPEGTKPGIGVPETKEAPRLYQIEVRR